MLTIIAVKKGQIQLEEFKLTTANHLPGKISISIRKKQYHGQKFMSLPGKEFKDIERLIEIAENAGLYLKRACRKGVSVGKKGAIDLVTEADINSEVMIKQALEKYFPYPVVGEESANDFMPGDNYFLVDPLDGTINFTRKIPFYAVSIALMDQVHAQAAVVHLPEFQETYFALKDKGAFLKKKTGKIARLSVSSTDLLADAILATGFPYDVWENYTAVLASLKAMLTSARAVRRFGSAAIDLCLVAAGVFDGYFEFSLKPWDTAAGSLIVEEAGGKVTNLKDERFHPFMPEICASNGLIHKELIARISKEIRLFEGEG
jgi:myo-inositol-1(or 4)-monophosphatase